MKCTERMHRDTEGGPVDTRSACLDREAALAFREYASGKRQSTHTLIRAFVVDRPTEAQRLIDRFRAAHPGLNHSPARLLTSTPAKVMWTLDEFDNCAESLHGWRRWFRTRRFALVVAAVLLFMPMLISPNHPIAVYGFLLDWYHPSVTSEAFAATGTDLRTFLISPEQVKRYRVDLREDMLDTCSGKLFALVRCPDGSLKQEAIRTWNGFLPESTPSFVRLWSDRKEIPFLGDEVDTWLRGSEIVAMGHYHALGGAPSAGDRRAQVFSELPEIVVVNGVVPLEYMDGEIVLYAEDVVVPEDVLKSMRAVEPNLFMDESQRALLDPRPSRGVKSVLGYLRDYRGVDINRKANVAQGVLDLCVEFRSDHSAVFPQGYTLAGYTDSLDIYNFLENLQAVHGWANCVSYVPGSETRASS